MAKASCIPCVRKCKVYIPVTHHNQSASSPNIATNCPHRTITLCSLVCVLCSLVNLIVVFICVMLWNNYVVSIGEITDDGGTCRRVTRGAMGWETPGGGRQSFDVGRCTIKLCT
ncbi:hypothetical protein HKD37_02G004648 [Glycine soja]